MSSVSTRTARVAVPRLYGAPAPWWALYEQIISGASDLRGQLEQLGQAAHAGADPRLVEQVRAVLWGPYQAHQTALAVQRDVAARHDGPEAVAASWGALQTALARKALRTVAGAR